MQNKDNAKIGKIISKNASNNRLAVLGSASIIEAITVVGPALTISTAAQHLTQMGTPTAAIVGGILVVGASVVLSVSSIMNLADDIMNKNSLNSNNKQTPKSFIGKFSRALLNRSLEKSQNNTLITPKPISAKSISLRHSSLALKSSNKSSFK